MGFEGCELLLFLFEAVTEEVVLVGGGGELLAQGELGLLFLLQLFVQLGEVGVGGGGQGGLGGGFVAPFVQALLTG